MKKFVLVFISFIILSCIFCTSVFAKTLVETKRDDLNMSPNIYYNMLKGKSMPSNSELLSLIQSYYDTSCKFIAGSVVLFDCNNSSNVFTIDNHDYFRFYICAFPEKPNLFVSSYSSSGSSRFHLNADSLSLNACNNLVTYDNFLDVFKNDNGDSYVDYYMITAYIVDDKVGFIGPWDKNPSGNIKKNHGTNLRSTSSSGFANGSQALQYAKHNMIYASSFNIYTAYSDELNSSFYQKSDDDLLMGTEAWQEYIKHSEYAVNGLVDKFPIVGQFQYLAKKFSEESSKPLILESDIIKIDLTWVEPYVPNIRNFLIALFTVLFVVGIFKLISSTVGLHSPGTDDGGN